MLPSRPLPNPLLTTQWKLARRLWWCSVGWLASVVIFIWRIWGVPMEGFGLVWLALGIAFHLWLLRSIVGQARWKGSRITFGPDTFCVYSEGRLLHEVPYRAVAGYRFHKKARKGWLRIRRNDGLPDIQISHAGFFSSPSLDQDKIVEALGPRIPADARQDRRPRPETPLAAHLWDHYGHPPPVKLEPGHVYAHIGPDEAPSNFGLRMSAILGGFALLQIIKAAVPALLRHQDGAITWLGIVVSALFLASMLFLGLVAAKISRGADVIIVMDDGIEVERKGRVKLYGGPPRSIEKWFGHCLLSQPTVRYGRGLRTYYVFPALIEKIK